MSPFQPLVYIRDLKEINFVSREKFSFDEFYGLISRSFARVKCGNIMSGFRKCCDCLESSLLCNLAKVLIDNLRYIVWLLLPENFVPSIKTLRECLV